MLKLLLIDWGHSSIWLERFPVTEEVGGSSPLGPAEEPVAQLARALH